VIDTEKMTLHLCSYSMFVICLNLSKLSEAENLRQNNTACIKYFLFENIIIFYFLKIIFNINILK